MCCVVPCLISLLCSLCPVPAGSVERLQTRISRLEEELANSRKDNNLLTEQIAEEKIKNSKMEVEKQEAVAKVLVEKASELPRGRVQQRLQPGGGSHDPLHGQDDACEEKGRWRRVVAIYICAHCACTR